MVRCVLVFVCDWLPLSVCLSVFVHCGMYVCSLIVCLAFTACLTVSRHFKMKFGFNTYYLDVIVVVYQTKPQLIKPLL